MPPNFKDHLEISTGVVCPNNCLQYCPKEVFIKNYPGDKSQLLSLADFKKILSTVPKSVTIRFSGFCEPFVNRDTIDMVKFAHASGHKVDIFTTLCGASAFEVDELIKIPVSTFCLHLPDGAVLSFPLTDEYLLNVFKVFQRIKNIRIVSMDDSFTSDNRENVVRGTYRQSHRFRHCNKWATPKFMVLPNGDVQLCARDFGLWHKVGNLLEEDYLQIRKRYIRSHNFELCTYCSKCQPYPTYVLNTTYSWIYNCFVVLNHSAVRAYRKIQK
jgi:hypothetical protein